MNSAPKRGYIYVVGSFERRWFKIGRSFTPGIRMSKIMETAAPFPCDYRMVFHTVDMYAAEGILHRMFAQRRTNGEWFRLEEKEFDLLHCDPVLELPLTVHANEDCLVCKQ